MHPSAPSRGLRDPTAADDPLRLGLIADLHRGLDPRAQECDEDLVAAETARPADMLVQLGDFDDVEEAHRPRMAAWNAFSGERHHVLGNHDLAGSGVHDVWVHSASYDRAFDECGRMARMRTRSTRSSTCTTTVSPATIASPSSFRRSPSSAASRSGRM